MRGNPCMGNTPLILWSNNMGFMAHVLKEIVEHNGFSEGKKSSFDRNAVENTTFHADLYFCDISDALQSYNKRIGDYVSYVKLKLLSKEISLMSKKFEEYAAVDAIRVVNSLAIKHDLYGLPDEARNEVEETYEYVFSQVERLVDFVTNEARSIMGRISDMHEHAPVKEATKNTKNFKVVFSEKPADLYCLDMYLSDWDDFSYEEIKSITEGDLKLSALNCAVFLKSPMMGEVRLSNSFIGLLGYSETSKYIYTENKNELVEEAVSDARKFLNELNIKAA